MVSDSSVFSPVMVEWVNRLNSDSLFAPVLILILIVVAALPRKR
jgi:hypothetical protein